MSDAARRNIRTDFGPEHEAFWPYIWDVHDEFMGIIRRMRENIAESNRILERMNARFDRFPELEMRIQRLEAEFLNDAG
jgi:hypothetical protein